MDNPAESRSDSSADSKKCNQSPHLTDEQLLLALDGELSARESARVEGHLEACWSCRAHSEQIEEAIADVVEYRYRLTKPFLPLSPGGRAIFVAQLQQLGRSVGRPSLWCRILGSIRALWAVSQGVAPRYLWISGLVMATFATFFLTRLGEVPNVSASQLLENAEVSEVRSVHSVAKPVVYQKLRIRIGSQTVTRTIYRDPERMRQRDHLDQTSGGGEVINRGRSPGGRKNQPQSIHSAKDEIQLTFLAARLNWQDPLSPASYRDWRNSLSEKRDAVSIADNSFLTLTTTTPEGPIAEARLTVRTSDFHPVSENLRLQDTRQVEVDELAWEVLPMDAINPAIFAPESMLPPELIRPANLAPPPQLPTDADLTESELQARVAIHAERADLGEQIELDRDTRSGQRSVLIRGIVSTSERKNRLLSVLRGIPHVELQVQTVEEAATQQNQVTADRPQGGAARIAQEAPARENRIAFESVAADGQRTPAGVVAVGPVLEEQLAELYPKVEDRAAFINGAVELVQEAMAQAWALRRLRDRYAPDTVAELSRGSKQTLELLIRDHVSMLRQQVDEARNMVSPLVPSEPVAEVPPTQMVDALPAAPVGDWRYALTEIFPEVQRVQENVAALLAGSGEAATEKQSLLRDLHLALAKLKAQLPMLYQQVSGAFLSEPKNGNK